MTLESQPAAVAGVEGSEGQLVFLDGQLVAVLTRLSDIQGNLQGHWFLEAGFGRLSGVHHSFPDLEIAEAWIAAQLGL